MLTLREITDFDIREHFFNRKSELELVDEALNADREDVSRSQRIINFFGISGVGKSAFMTWLQNSYDQHIPCFVLRTSQVKKISRLEFLETFLHFLQQQFHQLPSLYPLPTSDATEQELEDILVRSLKDVDTNDSARGLFLFDDYDRWPLEVRKWFEKNILRPIVHNHGMLVILTSRLKLVFHGLPTLSFHTRFHELETFTPQMIEEQYHEYREIARDIVEVTAGLPICIEWLVKYLHSEGILPSDFPKHKTRLVQMNYEEFIQGYILDKLTQDVHDTICILSIPRRFNMSIMSTLLPTILPERYEGFADFDYLAQINQFGYLALWNPANHGYTIQKAVRHIITYYMTLFDLEAYRKVNRLLLDLYTERIHKEDLNIHNLVEYLYHYLLFLKFEPGIISPKISLTQEFSRLVEEVFQDYAHRETELDNLNALREMIETDEQFRVYLTKETRQCIERILRAC